MNESDLYSAVVTSVPFLLLALVADSKLFGPSGASRRGRRIEQLADGFFLLVLAIGFVISLCALTVDDPPDILRPYAALGFGLGALGAFMHAGLHVARLYRGAPEGSSE